MGRFVFAGEIAFDHRAGEDEQVAKPLQFLRGEQRGPGRLPENRRAAALGARTTEGRAREREYRRHGAESPRAEQAASPGPGARRPRRVAALEWIGHGWRTGVRRGSVRFFPHLAQNALNDVAPFSCWRRWRGSW